MMKMVRLYMKENLKMMSDMEKENYLMKMEK